MYIKYNFRNDSNDSTETKLSKAIAQTSQILNIAERRCSAK